jgi:hypothetical protein
MTGSKHMDHSLLSFTLLPPSNGKQNKTKKLSAQGTGSLKD